MSRWTQLWENALLRIMGSDSRGRAQAVRDLRRAREVFRFALVFAAMILLPALFLSYFALTAIQSGEATADAELRSRAESMTDQVRMEITEIFSNFELEASGRLQRRESLLDNLSDLSPYLRGAYRFDKSGTLVAPFLLEASVEIDLPSARYSELATQARALSRRKNHADAAKLWSEAAGIARHPTHVAEARLAQAREVAHTDPATAIETYTQLLANHPQTRHTRGYLIRDLGALKRAELVTVFDPEKGADALLQLVDELVYRRWAVGYGGEASIARRALDALTLAKRSPDKVKQARARINERSDQLYWAEIVERELSIIDVYSPDQGLLYITAQADSASVWATYSNENGSWSFSFDLTTLQHDLAAMVARLNELEPDLAVQLMLPGVSAPDTSMIARPLPAPLGSIQVSVQPADPEGLERVRQSAAQTRRIVILVSVFMVLMGVVFSARIVSREVENARVKADFAANVSHELRSPITQIRLKGEALQYGLVDPGQDMQDHFDAIVREAERLSRLVDNVLDFAAIERGAKRYHLRQDDLIAVVWNTAEAMRATIEGQGLTLELDVPDDLRPIWIDREAIAQVLINLMSNAAKYGASGGWVGISIRQSHTGVDVSVSDRGIGISAEDSNQIFEHFYRSTDPNVRKKKGTGIGLTIVRYIVEAHGGTIAVDSAPNRGSTFTITFPFDPPTGHGA